MHTRAPSLPSAILERERERGRKRWRTGRKETSSKNAGIAVGARTSGWWRGGGLTVAEPSLLNVNVRHLLLRLYDPLLFVCICSTGPARRPRRRKGRIERMRRKSKHHRRSVVLFGAVFAPALGACPFFFCFGLFRTPSLFVSTLCVSHRLGTRSFVKFYDGSPPPILCLVSIMLYPLRTMRLFLFTNFVLITGSFSRHSLRRAHAIARERGLNDFTHRSENIPVYWNHEKLRGIPRGRNRWLWFSPRPSLSSCEIGRDKRFYG